MRVAIRCVDLAPVINDGKTLSVTDIFNLVGAGIVLEREAGIGGIAVVKTN